jgi:hypothetical protein
MCRNSAYINLGLVCYSNINTEFIVSVSAYIYLRYKQSFACANTIPGLCEATGILEEEEGVRGKGEGKGEEE